MSLLLSARRNGYDVLMCHEQNRLRANISADPGVEQTVAADDFAGERGVRTRERLNQVGLKFQQFGPAFLRRSFIGDGAKLHGARQALRDGTFVDGGTSRSRDHDLLRPVPQRIGGENRSEQNQDNGGPPKSMSEHMNSIQ